MRILLLSAYDADSHRYWRQQIVSQFPDYDWTQLVLPGRYFNWRIRGNSLQWALTERFTLEQDYDLIIATSMVDLSALKGMVPNLAAIPSLVYFHENQFAYPVSQQQTNTAKQANIEPMMVNLYTAVCATQLAFNSAYNRDSFIAGVADLMKRLPEKLPASLLDDLHNKSQVLPIPIALQSGASDVVNHTQQTINLVWNHRWEYDKGPDLLLACLRELREQNIDFKLHLLGQQFRKQPEALQTIQAEFADQLGQVGFVESKQEYEALLQTCDYVISTAYHEFQGLAVGEAVQCGCLPLLPKRLSYPGLIGAEHCFDESRDLAQQAKAFVAQIKTWQQLSIEQRQTIWQTLPVQSYNWQSLGPAYQACIEATAGL